MPDSRADADLTVEDIGEFGLIDRLARIVGKPGVDPLQPTREGDIGIGDDAALWHPTPGATEVLTTDALIEDVHFRLSTTSWRDLGWKALAENVSDVAAMGARPTRAFVTLGLPRGTRVANLDELYRGLGALAEQYGLVMAGGDVVSSPVLMLSIAVVGELQGPGLRRAAGRPGDLLAVTGDLGGSAGGLELLEQGSPDFDDPSVSNLVHRHRRPHPRVAEGLILAEAGVGCGMDLSDGLLGDAGKLAYASGLAATIEIERLPYPATLERQFGEDAARISALRGGEDYELLVAARLETIARASDLLIERGHQPLTIVGRLEEGRPGAVTILDAQGQPTDVGSGSWDHFRQQRSDA